MNVDHVAEIYGMSRTTVMTFVTVIHESRSCGALMFMRSA